MMAYLLNQSTEKVGVVHPQLYDCLVTHKSVTSYIADITKKQHLLFPIQINYHWSHVVVYNCNNCNKNMNDYYCMLHIDSKNIHNTGEICNKIHSFLLD